MTAIESPVCDCRSGVPSRLGRLGRAGGIILLLDCEGADLGLMGDGSGGDVMTGSAGTCEILEGDSSFSDRFGDFLNFCDDFLGGGLGGHGESLFFFFFSLAFPSP